MRGLRCRNLFLTRGWSGLRPGVLFVARRALPRGTYYSRSTLPESPENFYRLARIIFRTENNSDISVLTENNYVPRNRILFRRNRIIFRHTYRQFTTKPQPPVPSRSAQTPPTDCLQNEPPPPPPASPGTSSTGASHPGGGGGGGGSSSSRCAGRRFRRRP